MKPIAFGVLLATLVGNVSAAPINYEFTGAVSYVDGDVWTVPIGARVTGSFHYDSDRETYHRTLEQVTGPEQYFVVHHQFNNGQQSPWMVATFHTDEPFTYTGRTDPYVGGPVHGDERLVYTNNGLPGAAFFMDHFEIRMPSTVEDPLASLRFQLSDESSTALDGVGPEALPTVLNLDDFGLAFGELAWAPIGGFPTARIFFDLTDLRAVPEPTTWRMLVMALPLLGMVRKTKTPAVGCVRMSTDRQDKSPA